MKLTPPNPLDWLIWPHTFGGQPAPAWGYDFGFWVEDELWKLGNCMTVDQAERLIRIHYIPKSITILDREPTTRQKASTP